MRRAIVIVVSAVLATVSTWAAEPNGEWRVEDGSAIIKIDNCGGALWGVVAWERSPGGRDDQNPNPTLRGRPLLGSAVLINMRKTAQERWDGQVYNAQNGKTYSANVSMAGDNSLRIQGCVLGGVICGGQQWTRVGNKTARGGDVCSRVSNLPRGTH